MDGRFFGVKRRFANACRRLRVKTDALIEQEISA
jgi:hypothetical protein